MKHIIDLVNSKEDKFVPVLSNEVITDSQGIVGLNLRDSIIWLANRTSQTTVPSNESISDFDVQGDDEITNYTVEPN